MTSGCMSPYGQNVGGSDPPAPQSWCLCPRHQTMTPTQLELSV